MFDTFNEYKTTQWRAIRLQWLAANPWCARCEKPAVDVDHIEPHGGDVLRFWDATLRGALQSLCKACHRSKTSATKHKG